jgi:hypothetical protein
MFLIPDPPDLDLGFQYVLFFFMHSLFTTLCDSNKMIMPIMGRVNIVINLKSDVCGYIQGVYSRMVRFKKLTRNLFILHGQNVTVSSGNCPRFLCINHNPSIYAPWVTRHTSTRWSNSSHIVCVCGCLHLQHVRSSVVGEHDWIALVHSCENGGSTVQLQNVIFNKFLKPHHSFENTLYIYINVLGCMFVLYHTN